MSERLPHRTIPLHRPLRGLDLERHLEDPALRQAYVTSMFDLIAPRYDDFTRLFSFGMDRRWKNTLIAMAGVSTPRSGRVADVATGTGDLAYSLLAARPDLEITAVDVSSRMLALARTRGAESGQRVRIAAGDVGALPFGDASLEGVTAGYALRNTADWRVSIAELARVIKPGGHLFTLDFYLPPSAPWRATFLGWLSWAGRAVGWWWHREPMAYGYIARSIAHFTTAGEFGRELNQTGFVLAATRVRLAGGIAIHHAVRR